MAAHTKNEKPEVIDDCLTSMCSWIQDSSQFKSNENDQLLMSMLESWQPRTLFMDLPGSKKDSFEKSSDRVMENALLEFTDENNDGSEILIAQYISTNIKKQDHTEIQRCAMHMELGPSTENPEGLEKGVEEMTKNQAKVMKKNFTLYKDGKPLRTGKIHMVNMGREKQGNSPMKFSLNYLSTNVPNIESSEYKGNGKERSLQPYVNNSNFRRTLEKHRLRKPLVQDVHEPLHNVEKKETMIEHPDDHHNQIIHHAPNYQIEIHDNGHNKDRHGTGVQENNEKVHHHNYQAHKPIMTEDHVDSAHIGHNRHVEPNHKEQLFEEFETPIVHHQTTTKSSPVAEEFRNLPRESKNNFAIANNYTNQGFVRAYRYHSKRRSASLYEWPAPSGSFRMLKAD